MKNGVRNFGHQASRSLSVEGKKKKSPSSLAPSPKHCEGQRIRKAKKPKAFPLIQSLSLSCSPNVPTTVDNGAQNQSRTNNARNKRGTVAQTTKGARQRGSMKFTISAHSPGSRPGRDRERHNHSHAKYRACLLSGRDICVLTTSNLCQCPPMTNSREFLTTSNLCQCLR